LIPDVEENGIDPAERARPLHRPIRETAAPDVQGSSSCPMAATLSGHPGRCTRDLAGRE
jgi:hypothetical protein